MRGFDISSMTIGRHIKEADMSVMRVNRRGRTGAYQRIPSFNGFEAVPSPLARHRCSSKTS